MEWIIFQAMDSDKPNISIFSWGVSEIIITVYSGKKSRRTWLCTFIRRVDNLMSCWGFQVSGLHPASTYYMSVSAKTVSLGPSQSLVVNTRPPHLPFSVLPVWNTIQLADNGEGTPVNQVEWLPQSHLSELNVSDIYTPLVK